MVKTGIKSPSVSGLANGLNTHFLISLMTVIGVTGMQAGDTLYYSNGYYRKEGENGLEPLAVCPDGYKGFMLASHIAMDSSLIIDIDTDDGPMHKEVPILGNAVVMELPTFDCGAVYLNKSPDFRFMLNDNLKTVIQLDGELREFVSMDIDNNCN